MQEPGTRLRCHPALAYLGAAALIGLTACSSPQNSTAAPEENTLASHLGLPLEEFPGIADGAYVLSLTQDVRLGSLSRSANQVAPTETGWVVVAICADTPTIDRRRTENLILRVVAAEFIDDRTLRSIQDAEMQDGVICGNAAPIGPLTAEG